MTKNPIVRIISVVFVITNVFLIETACDRHNLPTPQTISTNVTNLNNNNNLNNLLNKIQSKYAFQIFKSWKCGDPLSPNDRDEIKTIIHGMIDESFAQYLIHESASYDKPREDVLHAQSRDDIEQFVYSTVFIVTSCIKKIETDDNTIDASYLPKLIELLDYAYDIAAKSGDLYTYISAVSMSQQALVHLCMLLPDSQKYTTESLDKIVEILVGWTKNDKFKVFLEYRLRILVNKYDPDIDIVDKIIKYYSEINELCFDNTNYNKPCSLEKFKNIDDKFDMPNDDNELSPRISGGLLRNLNVHRSSLESVCLIICIKKVANNYKINCEDNIKQFVQLYAESIGIKFIYDFNTLISKDCNFLEFYQSGSDCVMSKESVNSEMAYYRNGLDFYARIFINSH